MKSGSRHHIITQHAAILKSRGSKNRFTKISSPTACFFFFPRKNKILTLRQNFGAVKWFHFFSLWPEEFKWESLSSHKNLKTRATVSSNPFQLVGDWDEAIKSKRNCPERRLFKFNLIQDFRQPTFSHDNPINDLILNSLFCFFQWKRREEFSDMRESEKT